MSSKNITIKKTNWAADKEDLSTIRRLVFIEEQHVPQVLEWDELDESSYHFLVAQNTKAIACARLQNDGKIGRMAVLKQFRNQGIGSQLLNFIVQTAEIDSIDKLYLYAQVSAIPFYESQGFYAVGDIFYEAEIAHRKMLKTDRANN